METHRKKRIEIIIEAPLEQRVVALLNALQVTGYTVMPAIGGRGHEGVWRREGMVGDAGQMIVLVCIVDPSKSDEVVSEVYDLISTRIGIVSVSEVDVVRGDHF